MWRADSFINYRIVAFLKRYCTCTILNPASNKLLIHLADDLHHEKSKRGHQKSMTFPPYTKTINIGIFKSMHWIWQALSTFPLPLFCKLQKPSGIVKILHLIHDPLHGTIILKMCRTQKSLLKTYLSKQSYDYHWPLELM